MCASASACSCENLDLENWMNAEYIVSGIIAMLLLFYLMYALLRPEKF